MNANAIVSRKTVNAPILGNRRVFKMNAVKNYKPRTFFRLRVGRSRRDLWLYVEFVSRIVARARQVKSHPAQTLVSRELIISAADIDIIPALGKRNCNFSKSKVCALIEQLISKQRNGIPGPLLTNGNNNLFYVANYPVRVIWNKKHGDWDIRTWKFNSFWRAGDRVFSRI